MKIGSALSGFPFLQNRRYGVAERLAALVECRLDNLLEQLLVASQLLGLVAGHADDGAFTLGGGLNTCSCTVNRYSTLYQA